MCIAPGLLATICSKAARATDDWRAVTATGTAQLQFLARDEDSGFCLLGRRTGEPDPNWSVIPLPETAPALRAGAPLSLQSSAPVPATVAGRELLHSGKLLRTPWLRIHLPSGEWPTGTPLTAGDGSLAGMLASSVPGVPEAARILPVEAVRHFAALWAKRQTLARAELGFRLYHTDAIPCIQQCYAALPAERAGMRPGDVILKIGSTEVADASAVADACFYLRVDEPVKVTLLRGMETVETTVTPVSSPRRNELKPEK